MNSWAIFAAVIFWTCFALTVYSYLLYPVMIWLCARWLGSQGTPPQLETMTDLPRVALLVAAHNEQETIEAKIRNSLDLDYPKDKLAIVIASDGSSDATTAIAMRFAGQGVRVIDNSDRRGKAAVLNAAIAQTVKPDAGEILILSDANTDFDRQAIRNLVRWFADESVNCVCGRLVLTDAHGGPNVDSLYWRYETFLKKCEGRLGALLGANGAIYAIRSRAYVTIPDNTVIDDFVIPLLSELWHGGRIVYDPAAVACEETPSEIGAEFGRRVRIGAGAFQSLAILWPLLRPQHGWTAFAFFSHKLLRWLAPFFLLGMFVTSAVLLRHPLYQVLFAGEMAAVAMAALGGYVPGNSLPAKAIRAWAMLAGMNLALLLGFWRWILHRQTGTWQRTQR